MKNLMILFERRGTASPLIPGDLLTLDQVLKYTWSYLTIFGLQQLSKDEVQCEARKTYFWVTFRVLGLM
jgi:hypothetical protein